MLTPLAEYHVPSVSRREDGTGTGFAPMWHTRGAWCLLGTIYDAATAAAAAAAAVGVLSY